MRQFRVTNPSGLFYSPDPRSLLSEAVYQRLLTEASLIADPSERSSAESVLASVGRLPTFTSYHERCPIDPGHQPKPPGWRPDYEGHAYRDKESIKCRGWISLGVPKSASPSVNFTQSSPEECGWIALAEIEKNKATLEALLSAIGAPSIAKRLGKEGTLLVKKIDAVAFAIIDEERETMHSDSVALFVDHGFDAVTGRALGGFMDSKGRFGPLSRARMFESASAAGRTAVSHRLSNWCAVGVSMGVSEVFELKGSTVSSRILAALASKESADLDQMLNDADIAALRQKLAEIEASRQTESPAAAKPRPRL